MRAPAPGLALIVLLGGLVLVDCGGGGHGIARASSHANASERQLAALARTINLTATDVPAAKIVGTEGPSPGSRCGSGATASKVQIRSAVFERGFELDTALRPPRHEAVLSSVELAPTAMDARRAMLAYHTAAARRCVVEEEEHNTRSSGPLVAHHTTAAALAFAPPSPGFAFMTNRVQTYRSARPHAPTLLERHAPKRPSGIATDFIGFAIGRVRVTLVDEHEPGYEPVAIERRLLGLLYGRAKAHSPWLDH